MDKYKILAVIPARGGSKGLPGKNIIDLCGKPLISWTVEAAKQSKYIDEIHVSTDDLNIKYEVEKIGISVEDLRSKELSTDDALSIDVVLDVLTMPRYSNFDYVCMLQPTSPLRSANHIDEAFDLIFSLNANSCVSITENESTPFWSFELSHGILKSLFPMSVIPLRRQDLPPTYVLNGAIYIAKVEWLIATRSFICDETLGYVMDRNCSIDIDDSDDLEKATSILTSIL